MAQGDYEQGARVGLGIKMAHEAALRFAEDGNQYSQILGALVEPTIELVVNTQAKHLVTEAFPGATVETNVAQHLAQNQQPAPQPQYAPQPAPQGPGPAPVPMPPASPAQQDEEQLWRLLFSDFSAWYDNRASKKSPNGPDFRHKTMNDPKNPQFKVGLWVSRAPDWAKQQLGVA